MLKDISVMDVIIFVVSIAFLVFVAPVIERQEMFAAYNPDMLFMNVHALAGLMGLLSVYAFKGVMQVVKGE